MYRNCVSAGLVYLHAVLFICICQHQLCGAIECYSCKATASNEIEANIHCLEMANLEDCSEFYQYYSEIETESDSDDVIYDYEFPVIQGDIGRAGVPRDRKPVATPRDFPPGRRPTRFRRETGDDKGDYQYDDSDAMTSSKTPPGGGSAKNASRVEPLKQQMSLPTDPEHHCYSTTSKDDWERYTVEKGCKKIAYCRSHRENLPAVWTLPWNFCCDRSRCNAKLVKDKPQRIFAMGCRRTDDCIQGHNTRHVCPELFQSCPRVSSSVIKMECRVRQRHGQHATYTSRGPIYGSAYFNQFKDKKCFCARGYYPRGPICSGSDRNRNLSGISAISSMFVLYATLWAVLQQR